MTLLVLLYKFLNDYRFANTSFACEKGSFVAAQQIGKDLGVANRVNGGHKELVIWSNDPILEFWEHLVPVLEAHFLLLVEVLEDSFFWWNMQLAKEISKD